MGVGADRADRAPRATRIMDSTPPFKVQVMLTYFDSWQPGIGKVQGGCVGCILLEVFEAIEVSEIEV